MSVRSPFDDLPTSPALQSVERSGAERGSQQQSGEIELSVLWDGIRRYLPALLLTSAAVSGLTYLWSKSQPPVFEASSSLVTTNNSNLNSLQNTLVTASPLPQGALQQALQGPTVLGEIIQQVKADSTLGPAERQLLSKNLQTELQMQKLKTLALSAKLDLGGNGIYTVTAKGPTPVSASHLADLAAQTLLNWDRGRALSGVERAQKALTAQLKEIDRQLHDGQPNDLEHQTLVAARATAQRNLAQAGIQQEGITGSLEMVSPAVTPLSPVAPKPVRNGILAGLLTLLLGMGVAALRTVTDRTARNEDDLLNFGLPTLGTIPQLRKRDVVFNGIVRAARQAGLYESIGFLRVNLLSRLGNSSGRAHKVMISSTAPGEGKSSLTAALADGLASSGQRVLIIDADMRRGTQQEVWDKYEKSHDWVQLSGEGGARTLQEAFLNPMQVQVMQVEPGVHVLPAGPGIQDSLGVLNRADLKACFDLWGQNYDVMLIDSPPLLALADGLLLGRAADAALLVVEEGKTSLQAIRQSLRRAEGSHLNVLGFILNKVSVGENRSYVYSYGYAPKGR